MNENNKIKNIKIALVHDYLAQFGGAERVLSALCELFPEAPIYTLIYDKKSTGYVFEKRKIITSFLQKIPLPKKYFRSLFWLMPIAAEQFDLSDYDLVISISTSYAKGVVVPTNTFHISYCSTPPRYLWHHSKESLDEFRIPKIFRPFLNIFLTYLRIWDYQAAQRVDFFVANSENVKKRIKFYYNRDSKVIYPPLESKKFFISDKSKDYFLMVGRMVPYKRFDIAIDAFSWLSNEKLIVVGKGPEFKELKSKVKRLRLKNIKFVGLVSDNELPSFYANCKALIFPQEEDFGIVPLEAMACGRPVIAFKAGGALETVVENKTGIFFENQSSDSLIEAVKKFNKMKFDSEAIRNHALGFDKQIFKKKILELTTNLIK